MKLDILGIAYYTLLLGSTNIFCNFLEGKEMTKQQNQANREKIETTDLSPTKLITMCYKQLKEQVLAKKENLENIACDERHVRVLIFRMLCENNDAIRKFNRNSTLLSLAILALVILQVFLAYK